jgi:CRISPR type IV-associated protein Csf2
MKKIIGPITLTSPLQVPSAFRDGDVMEMKVQTQEKVERVPFFPGNDLRGRLRRKATDIIIERANCKIPLALYHSMSCGAVTGSPSKDKKGIEYAPVESIAALSEAKQNVFAGLFGGGFNMVSSGYRVSDMVPAIEMLDELGMLPDGYDGDILPRAPFELKDQFLFNRWDDLGKSPSKVMDACSNEDIVDWQALTVDSIVEGEDGKKDKARNGLKLSNFQSFYAVVPGTVLAFQMDLKRELTDAQIGLMLMSLERLANEQALGAASRKGFGRFDAFGLKFVSKDKEVDLFVHSGDVLNPYQINFELMHYLSEFVAISDDPEAMIESISRAMTTDMAKPKK